MTEQPWVDERVRCADPECSQEQPSAEPEQDGEARYYACPCGFEFGHNMVKAAEGTCAMGISEGARRVLNGPQEPVFVSIGRRPE